MGRGRQNRRPKTVAAHIAHEDRHLAVGKRNEIEEIAAAGFGGFGEAGDVQAGHFRGAVGEQGLLDVAGDVHFLFDLPAFGHVEGHADDAGNRSAAGPPGFHVGLLGSAADLGFKADGIALERLQMGVQRAVVFLLDFKILGDRHAHDLVGPQVQPRKPRPQGRGDLQVAVRGPQHRRQLVGQAGGCRFPAAAIPPEPDAAPERAGSCGSGVPR